MDKQNELVQEADTSSGIFWVAGAWAAGIFIGLLLVAVVGLFITISILAGACYLAQELFQKARRPFQFVFLRFNMPS